jgi:transposase, IS30 family
MRISHATIYRYAYSKDGQPEKFCRHLLENRMRRRPRGTRRYHGCRLFKELAISHRNQVGHWECDLVMFRNRCGKVNVTTLVECVSRFAVVLKTQIVSQSQ